MSQAHATNLLAGPIVMFLSAAILGYFGYFVGLRTVGPADEPVFIFALLVWTLRIAALAMLFAGMITFASPLAGNVFYAIFSGLMAIALVVLGVMDHQDDQYDAAISPVLAFIFAAWNGYGAWSGLSEVLAIRFAPEPAENRTRGATLVQQVVDPGGPADK